MKTWVRKSLKVGVLSAGIILVAGGAAQADWDSTDNDGVLSGNQVLADIDVPINVCGNAIPIIGEAAAACTIDGGGSGEGESAGSWTSTENDGIGSGNQVEVPVEIPINICGNAIGIGDSVAVCQIGGEDGGTGTGGYSTGSTESWTSTDNDGVLSGNQVLADIDVPINVCGNAIPIFGDAAAACAIGGNGGEDESLGDWTSEDNDGVLSGNQIAAIVDVPINVCGNAIPIFGDATAACSIGGGELPETPDPTTPTDPGDGTDQGGDYGDEARRGQAESLPIFGSLLDLHKLTQANPVATTAGDAIGARHESAGWTTTDNDGVLSGNQILADVNIPVNVVGNAVPIFGDAVAVGHVM